MLLCDYFLLTAESAEGAESERNIEEKRDVLKKIFVLVIILSWELETPESFPNFISERPANRSKFV